jgi:hypothetical protein
MTLSTKAKSALSAAYATRGKHRGQLLAKCPLSSTNAAAAWQGAMMCCNPYKVGICAIMFMSAEQREIFNEVKAHFDALPREHMIMAQRDREALESLGVW